MRGLGELAVVSDLPPWVVDLFGLLTHLGDPWVVLGALAFAYAVADRAALDRRRVASVLAAGFVALGVTLALKSAFALPRPPGALEEGFGFPSGHALGATVVWGLGVALLDVGPRRRRLLLASVVVLAVAASRVVIGVHYLVDVVAGVAVGVGVVGLVLALVGPDSGRLDHRIRPGPDRAVSYAAVDRVFALAAAAAAVAFAVSAVTGVGTTTETLLTVGASLGGWWGWRLVEPAVGTRRPPLPLRGTVVAVVGLPVVLGGLLAVDTAADAAAVPDPVAAAVAGSCVALLIALPRVADRLVGST
jgi:membrane-associated phospholipid phosphatase